jgi:hypothetical protein
MQKPRNILFILWMGMAMVSCNPGVDNNHHQDDELMPPLGEGQVFWAPDFGYGPSFSISKPMTPTGLEFQSIPDLAEWQGFDFYFYHIPVERLEEFINEISAGYTLTRDVSATKELVTYDTSGTQQHNSIFLQVNPNPAVFSWINYSFHSSQYLYVEFHRLNPIREAVLLSTFGNVKNSTTPRVYYNSNGLGEASRRTHYPINVGEDFYLIGVYVIKNVLGTEFIYVPVNHKNPLRYTLHAQ